MIKKADENTISNWLSALAGDGKLFGTNAEIDEWGIIKNVSSMGNAFEITFSPKSIFLPRRQKLFEMDADKPAETIREVLPDIPDGAVLWGLRPCDARALELVRRVFNENEIADPYFNIIWDRIVRIAVGCSEPQDTCFCTSFVGGNPFGTQGVDVLATKIENFFILEPITKAGEDVVKNFPDADEKDIEKLAQIKKYATGKVNSSVPTDIADELLEIFYDVDFWKNSFANCQGCGNCTEVCPGCYCFDIVDERNDEKIFKNRVWDSCISEDFTLSIDGENPRRELYRRQRQRIMHKFSYFALRYDGTQLCVGCGRCVQHCPSQIDIRKVVKNAVEENIVEKQTN